MKETKLGKVRRFALEVIKVNPSCYSEDLMDLIPPELLELDLTDGNLHETGIKIDEIRFQKEAEFAHMVALPYKEATKRQMKELAKMINSDIGSLSKKQEAKKREIKFLSNLAQIIIHQ